MIHGIVNEKSFYFSYQLDLSKSIQSTITELVATNSKPPQNSILADLALKYPNSIGYQSNFIFNNYLLKDFEHFQYTAFKVPCIFGYLYIKPLQMDS